MVNTRIASSVWDWRKRFNGIQSVYPVMTSPPTITVGGASATVNSNTGGAVSIAYSDSRITNVGTVLVDDGTGRGLGSHMTLADSSKTASNCPIRTRFMTDAPAFEVVFRGTGFQYVGVIVDGQYAGRTSRLGNMPNDGNPHNVKFDFSADATAYYLDQITKSAGGSGYVIGDTITLAGGTGTAAVVKVTQVSTGAVAQIEPVTGGAYSAVPTGTISQASTSGVGTGATFVSPVWSKSHTNRKMRRIEVLWHGSAAKITGINIGAQDTVLAWPVPALQPKLCIIGDSQNNGTYLDYAGGHMGASIAQALGLWDNLIISALGGTGYNVVNSSVTPNAPKWSDALRIADFIAHNADIYLLIGSQNDAAGSPLQAAVTAVINGIQASLPNAYFVGIGSIIPSSTVNASISAGFAGASNTSRVAFIDNNAENWLTGTGYATAETGSGNMDFYRASDGQHLHQYGVDYFAERAAAAVAAKLLAMTV